VAADRQKRGLENESQPNGEKIELHWPEHAAAHFQNRVRDRRQKTNRRDNEEISIHRERPILNRESLLAILPFSAPLTSDPAPLASFR